MAVGVRASPPPLDTPSALSGSGVQAHRGEAQPRQVSRRIHRKKVGDPFKVVLSWYRKLPFFLSEPLRMLREMIRYC